MVIYFYSEYQISDWKCSLYLKARSFYLTVTSSLLDDLCSETGSLCLDLDAPLDCFKNPRAILVVQTLSLSHYCSFSIGRNQMCTLGGTYGV